MINDLMIRSFLTLSETLNFTVAAKNLYLSQQAVSKHIAKLEEDLNCQLFSRDRGKIQLTDAGRIYHRVFSQYKENMHQAAFEISGTSPADQNRIRIGHLELLDLNTLISPAISKFLKTYPDVTIEYVHAQDSELPILLAENKIDFAITFLHELVSRSSVEVVPLARSRELLLVSKNHPLATQDADYRAFVNEHVYFSVPPSKDTSQAQLHMDRLGFSHDRLICTDSILTACNAVDMMQGVFFAVEHSRVTDMGQYYSYPTGSSVEIVICMDKENKKRILPMFLNLF